MTKRAWTTTSALRRGVLAVAAALTLALTLSSAGGRAIAAAPTPSPDARFEAFLKAIDVVPASRAELEQAFPDARARLLVAAGEDAIALIEVDEPLTGDVLDKVHALEGVVQVKRLSF